MSAEKKSSLKARRLIAVLVFLLIIAGLLTAWVVWYLNLIPQRPYTAEELGIAVLASPLDADRDGVDDYTDIMLGARADAENAPRYDDSYHEGGYPPDDVGVCTDVVWRAFRHAGYDLKALVDYDISRNPELYPGLDNGTPDPNIDFRRVRNLRVFFDRHATVLTLDFDNPEDWQAGDIVTFGGDSAHIAVLSDLRNKDGYPWLIHNSGQPNREENSLIKLALTRGITGHYRWEGGFTLPKNDQLTLDIVQKLAQKGNELSWKDFEGYPSMDIGSGLYILSYPINERYHLLIGGFGPADDPVYIYLVDGSGGRQIDIRFEDVPTFLSESQ